MLELCAPQGQRGTGTEGSVTVPAGGVVGGPQGAGVESEQKLLRCWGFHQWKKVEWTSGKRLEGGPKRVSGS